MMTLRFFWKTALVTQDPKSAGQDKNHADAETDDDCHTALSWMRGASWMAATGAVAQHCATTSRAQLSHWPHWVATPSSNWISSKPMPARAWRAISRSEIRRQTQTIMVWAWLAVVEVLGNYKYESLAFAIPVMTAQNLIAEGSGDVVAGRGPFVARHHAGEQIFELLARGVEHAGHMQADEQEQGPGQRLVAKVQSGVAPEEVGGIEPARDAQQPDAGP